MSLLLFCQILLKIPPALFTLTSLELNPTLHFSFLWRKANKIMLFCCNSPFGHMIAQGASSAALAAQGFPDGCPSF